MTTATATALDAANPTSGFRQCDLDKACIERYGRQMVLGCWGPQAQVRLAQGRVLVIGAGGLGCPAVLYLAGAGLGRIGIVDHDRVEVSNLHRQIGHRHDRVGTPKAASLRQAALARNPLVDVRAYDVRFVADNALDLVADYDVLVDATDNVTTRYLINDVGVLTKKPVVCGSALGLEGQLTVYGWPGSCCYRCVFPDPPPAAAIGDCNNSGVLGPIPGIIGTLQALEVMKIIGRVGDPLIGRWMLFDGASMATRIVRLRGRNPDCAVCGDRPTILTPMAITATTSCSSSISDQIEHVSVQIFEARRSRSDVIVIDVRDANQFSICSLSGARNIPLKQLEGDIELQRDLINQHLPIYCICRRGNLSQRATLCLQRAGARSVFNVVGGIAQWASTVDPDLPIY